jgi:hypothetical protein
MPLVPWRKKKVTNIAGLQRFTACALMRIIGAIVSILFAIRNADAANGFDLEISGYFKSHTEWRVAQDQRPDRK